jgi:hypothetical protein
MVSPRLAVLLPLALVGVVAQFSGAPQAAVLRN